MINIFLIFIVFSWKINSMNINDVFESIKTNTDEIAINHIQKYLKSGGDLYDKLIFENHHDTMMSVAIAYDKLIVVNYLIDLGYDLQKGRCYLYHWQHAFLFTQNGEVAELILNNTDLYKPIEHYEYFRVPICLYLMLLADKCDDESKLIFFLNNPNFNINSTIKIFVNKNMTLEFTNLFYAAIYFNVKRAIFDLLLERGININDLDDSLKMARSHKSFISNFLEDYKKIKDKLQYVVPGELADLILSYYGYEKINNSTCAIA